MEGPALSAVTGSLILAVPSPCWALSHHLYSLYSSQPSPKRHILHTNCISEWTQQVLGFLEPEILTSAPRRVANLWQPLPAATECSEESHRSQFTQEQAGCPHPVSKLAPRANGSPEGGAIYFPKFGISFFFVRSQHLKADP